MPGEFSVVDVGKVAGQGGEQFEQFIHQGFSLYRLPGSVPVSGCAARRPAA